MKSEFSSQHPAGHNKNIFSILLATLCFLMFSSSVYAHEIHHIQMEAKSLPEGFLAYRMMSHCIQEHGDPIDECDDVTTDRYGSNPEATMPGPTIVITEDDIVKIDLYHLIEVANPEENENKTHVSLHVHGVHYDIDSDGTLEYINMHKDESARGPEPFMKYSYTWTAAEGTAGSWAYHDHNFRTHNGAEDRGLYGALIVNPESGTVDAVKGWRRQTVAVDEITKDFVLYVLDDTFMGMEIDNTNNHFQTPLYDNPTFNAPKNEFVRFHLIALGTNAHKFQLRRYLWLDPDTRRLINRKPIGSLENHVFTIRADRNSEYRDKTFSSKLLGMKGKLQVN